MRVYYSDESVALLYGDARGKGYTGKIGVQVLVSVHSGNLISFIGELSLLMVLLCAELTVFH